MKYFKKYNNFINENFIQLKTYNDDVKSLQESIYKLGFDNNYMQEDIINRNNSQLLIIDNQTEKLDDFF